MLVVSDTTPINYLVLIGEVDVLPSLYERVILPEAVVQELQHPRAPLLVQQWAGTLPPWIEVKKALGDQYPMLDVGESAALELALSLQMMLLADETHARAVAARLGVRTIGTVGILAEAHLRDLVDFDEAIKALRATNIRVSESLIETLRQRIRETQS